MITSTKKGKRNLTIELKSSVIIQVIRINSQVVILICQNTIPVPISMDVAAVICRVIRQAEPLPNFLYELLVRSLLLLALIIMHLKYQPQAIYITEAEMLNEYRKPRRDSYVPPWAMILSIIFVPLLILSLPAVLQRIYTETVQALLGWTLALLLNGIFTEFLKLLVCRPRPDFFYRCFPNGVVPIELYCTGNIKDVIDGRKSFPSGHSSFAFCSLGFLSLWLRGKLCVSSNRNVRINIFCLAPLVLAMAIGTSRCCDNHHHWQDVLVGGILGLVVSYVCYTIYCTPEERMFPRFCDHTDILQCCTRDLDNDLLNGNEKNNSFPNKKE